MKGSVTASGGKWKTRALLCFCALISQTSPSFKTQAGTGAATPVKHVVVIFQENVSFDHYFATYPLAGNPAGEPPFTSRSTPGVNGLTPGLLFNNHNLVQPFRLDRTQNY